MAGVAGHVATLTKIVVKTSELSLAKMAPAHMLELLPFTLLLAEVWPCKSLGYGFLALFPKVRQEDPMAVYKQGSVMLTQAVMRSSTE